MGVAAAIGGRTSLILLLIIFIDLVGFGIVVPILPFIVAEFGGNELVGGAIFAIYSLASIIGGPFWGRLSDRTGRRRALMLTLAGAVLSYVLLGLAQTLLMIFAARALSGLMGGNVGVVMAAIADNTTPNQRTRALGLVGVCFGMAFAVGPGLAGVLADIGGPNLLLPAMAAGGLSLTALILTWQLMPPLTPPGAHARGDDAPPRLSLFSFADNPEKIGLLLQFVLAAVAQSISFAMTGFWAKAQLGWSQSEVGYLMMATGLLVAFIQGVAIGPLTRRFGDVGSYQLGIVINLVGCAVLVLAPPTPVTTLIAFPLIMGGMTISYPVLNGLISKRNDATVQGAALGLANSMSATGRVIGPIAGGQLMTMLGPDAPFISVALVTGCAMVWAIRERMAGRN